MKKEFDLSKEIMTATEFEHGGTMKVKMDVIEVFKVKEFIKRLKEDFETDSNFVLMINEIQEKINKRAGEKLI